jgi:hypothetical protein
MLSNEKHDRRLLSNNPDHPMGNPNNHDDPMGDHDIAFNAGECQVMCFGHVVELCSRRVVKAASDGGDDGDDSTSSFDNSTTSSNLIAQAHAVV